MLRKTWRDLEHRVSFKDKCVHCRIHQTALTRMGVMMLGWQALVRELETGSHAWHGTGLQQEALETLALLISAYSLSTSS